MRCCLVTKGTQTQETHTRGWMLGKIEIQSPFNIIRSVSVQLFDPWSYKRRRYIFQSILCRNKDNGKQIKQNSALTLNGG